MADGTILKKDVIEDGAIQWGAEYQKNVKLAIETNKEFVATLILLKDANDKLRVSQDSKAYQASVIKTNELTQRSVGIWKEQEQIERSLISTKRKNQLATEATNTALVKERLLLQTTNKELKETAKTTLGLVSAYEKLNSDRLKAQKVLANLLSAEKLNTKEIKIAQLEYAKLDARVKGVDQVTKNYTKNIGNYKSAFQGLNSTARELVSTFGLLTGVALFSSIIKDGFNTIKDFDRQLIAVGKTTNIAGSDLKKFGVEVVELGRRLDGISVQGLLRSAEVAGTLGVKGTENLLKFSSAVEKLKLTSDIISDEQVQNFAKFIQVSSDSFENADKLASVITELGNNFATTEAQILGNATEIAKGIAVYNTSAEAIIGLGAATSSLGSEAESSRSAIQTTFKVINDAVATGKNLEKILKLTGLTQKELSDQFNKDATGVFKKFVKGLSDARDSGKNLSLVLDDLGISEKRAFTVVGSLAANYEVLENAMNSASKEYELNEALNKEVADAAESLSSIIGDIKDNYDAYILSLNEANGGTESFAKVLKFLRDNLGSIITGFGKAVAIVLTYVGVMRAFNFIVATSTALKTAAIAAELSFATATGIGRSSVLAQAAAVRSATVAQTGLNVAMTATPWGVILAALAAVVIAYKLFNEQLSENEKIQARISDNIREQKRLLEESKKINDDYRNSAIKGIEEEYALKKKRQGDSKELIADEIEAKQKYLRNNIDSNTQEIKANTELLLSIDKNSKKRIAIAEKEAVKLREIADRASFQGSKRAADNAEQALSKIRSESGNQKNNLLLRTEFLKEENKGIIDLQNELGKQTQLNEAEIDEENEKKKAERLKKFLDARKKRWKEEYEAQKKAMEDEFKLNQFRLQNLIDLNNDIIANEKSTIDDRILAIDENNQVLIKKNNEAAEQQFKLLGKYNEDTGKFIRELSDIEIQELIVNGKKKVDITKEQLLILETLQATQTKVAVDSAKSRTDAIDKEVASMKKLLELRIAEQTASQNKELTTANDNFINDVDLAGDNFKLLEEAQRRHEKAVFDIKKSYAIQGINLQIDTFQKLIDEQEKLPESERISGEEIKKIVQDLADFRRQKSELSLVDYQEDVQKRLELEKELNERLKDLAFEIGYALQDFANTLFDARIQNIDNEIRANEDFYNRQIELAGNDALQKELLQEEAERKREQLEKKKREELRKQAIFNKLVALAEIAINTAIAVSKVTAQSGVLAPLLIPAIIALGAVQAATVLATPIPKYKDGLLSAKKDHLAIVGDGGRSEVIEKKDGRSYMTPRTDTYAMIEKGDRVHKSVEDFERAKRASFMLNLQRQGKEASSAQFGSEYSKEILKEMKANTKAIQSNKQKIIFNAPKSDNLADELRRQRNTNWRA